MSPPVEITSEGSDLEIVRIDDQEPGTYLLYPPEATDEELETMWIRARETDLVCPEAIR